MRSTAETTGGLSSAYRGPALSRPAASKTSTGPHPSHSTDDSSTPPSPSSSWTRNEHVLLVGPVGVGKSFIAQALGYAAVRAGHTVRFVHADDFFRAMAQARVDHSTDKTFRSFIAPDLLILDDLGLHRMTQLQSIDLYELVIARHRTASFVITSNRAVDEWLGLFDDPILGNSALDRLANASYQIVIEGARATANACRPHRALLDGLDAKGGG